MRGDGDGDYSGESAWRPVRGGSWDSTPPICRLADRFGHAPGYVLPKVGFRLARSLPDGQDPIEDVTRPIA